MQNNTEFKIYSNYPHLWPSKRSEYVYLSLALMSLVYLFYIRYQDGSLRMLFVSSVIPILFLASAQYRISYPTLLYRIKFDDQYITVFNKTACLWGKSISDLEEIAQEEAKVGLKLFNHRGSDMLIMRTSNDSFSIPIKYVKFKSYSINEAIEKMRGFVKRPTS